MGSNLVDEIDCGSFFDHIGDIIEFSPDNNIDLGSGSCNEFPSIWMNTSDSILDSDPIFAGRNRNASASDLSAELAVPYEDIMQLEWLSTFVEDSFSGGSMTPNKDIIPTNNVESHNQFRTSSPVSVLESSSSSSGSEGKHILHGATQRARSKRPRPATFNPHSAMQVISPNSASDSPRLFIPIMSSEPEKLAESQQKPVPAPERKKKKKPKMSFPPDSMETKHSSPSQEAVMKCTHCEITKTPQWRAGPLGPKTLCNACGVRYKSGRLFPEYRPAASPTFTPSLHSNSHRKVIAMRTKGTEKNIMTDRILLPTTPEPELIPNLSAALNCISESRPGFHCPISPSSGFIC